VIGRDTRDGERWKARRRGGVPDVKNRVLRELDTGAILTLTLVVG